MPTLKQAESMNCSRLEYFTPCFILESCRLRAFLYILAEASGRHPRRLCRPCLHP